MREDRSGLVACPHPDGIPHGQVGKLTMQVILVCALLLVICHFALLMIIAHEVIDISSAIEGLLGGRHRR